MCLVILIAFKIIKVYDINLIQIGTLHIYIATEHFQFMQANSIQAHST